MKWKDEFWFGSLSLNQHSFLSNLTFYFILLKIWQFQSMFYPAKTETNAEDGITWEFCIHTHIYWQWYYQQNSYSNIIEYAFLTSLSSADANY